MRRLVLSLALLLLTPCVAWAELPEILKAAAGYDSEKTLEEMLAEDPELAHYRHPETGWTPINYAAREAELEHVRLLLDHGVDIGTSKEGVTALHSATMGRHPDVFMPTSQEKTGRISMQHLRDQRVATVKFLIERGADVNAPDGRGRGPLAVAAGEGMPEVIEVLLEAGAAVNPPDLAKTGGVSCPLFQALQQSRWDNAELLLDRGAEVEAYTREVRADPLLSIAVRNAPRAFIERMLEAGADVHHPAPISIAASHGRVEIVKLLESRMDKGERRQRALDAAVTNSASARQHDLSAFLREKGATESAEKRGLSFALIGIIWRGDRDVARDLVKRGAPADAYVLAAIGDLDALKAAVQKDPEALKFREVSRNATLLHASASCGNDDVSRWLLEQGLEVAATSRDGSTPLHRAAAAGRRSTVDLLLANGADVHAPMEHLYVDSRYTPLCLAAKHGRAEAAFRLLSAGAKIEHEHARLAAMLIAAKPKRLKAVLVDLEKPKDGPRLFVLVEWAKSTGSGRPLLLLLEDLGYDL